jgi:hypothetical protein
MARIQRHAAKQDNQGFDHIVQNKNLPEQFTKVYFFLL